MSLVLDASMTLAWLFQEDQSDGAEAVLLRVAAEGAWVPSLWRLEVANVLRNALRRGRCDDAHVDVSLARLSHLPITVDNETDDHAWGPTRILSREENLTVYDAAYLELALRKTGSLASCDADLLAAAVRRGVETLTT